MIRPRSRIRSWPSRVDALTMLCTDPEECARALKLGPRQQDWVAVDAAVEQSPTLPAADRYDGVLYRALDVPALAPDARRALGERVIIHSALFGLIGALDPIPNYRLSHDSRLPGTSLGRLWREPLRTCLAGYADELVLDARSAGYRALGPAPESALVVQVVTRGRDGTPRALNHFNKEAKGRLAAAVATAASLPAAIDDVPDWGAEHGLRLELGAQAPRELLLVV